MVRQTTRTNAAGYFTMQQQANTYLSIQFTGYQPRQIANPAELKAGGYNAITYISDKTFHEFVTWRRSLLL